MSGVPSGLVRDLLAESLVAWRVEGSVVLTDDGAIVIDGKRHIRVEPAPPGTMFRWLVTTDRRQRGAISLVGVLRQVRAAVCPGSAVSRARVCVVPLVPS